MTAALQQARARRPSRCDLAANVPELVQSPLTRGDRSATGARPERSGGNPAKRRRRDVGQRRKSHEAPPARRGTRPGAATPQYPLRFLRLISVTHPPRPSAQSIHGKRPFPALTPTRGAGKQAISRVLLTPVTRHFTPPPRRAFRHTQPRPCQQSRPNIESHACLRRILHSYPPTWIALRASVAASCPKERCMALEPRASWRRWVCLVTPLLRPLPLLRAPVRHPQCVPECRQCLRSRSSRSRRHCTISKERWHT
jgi:hypothetical protein